MAGWQEELAELLHELGVTQEEPQTHPRSRHKPARNATRWRLHPNKLVRHMTDAVVPETDEGDDSEQWLAEDLEAMRHEVDSIVRQVVQLMQHGDLDPTLKEDILEILRVLRRRSSLAQASENETSLDLETITAMLRFCRVILCLSETTIEDF